MFNPSVNANFIISVVRVKIFNGILDSLLSDELLHSEDIQTTELDTRITTNKTGSASIRPVFRGVLNRVYGILRLKYGYSVYHFL